MNDQARKLLAFVIHHYGVDVIQTPKHLQALLKDHAKGQFKPEISLFMQAVNEGLVANLLANQQLPVQSLSARAIKHLQEDYFIEKQAAHWVIDSWCIALKLSRPIPINTTLAPVTQTKPSPVAVIKLPVPPPTPTVQATFTVQPVPRFIQVPPPTPTVQATPVPVHPHTSPPTPTVQVTPVPVIQETSVLYKIMKLLSYLSLFYLLVVVPIAILSKQDKTPAIASTPKAAKQGSHNLEVMKTNAESVVKDNTKTEEQLRKDAEQGDAEAKLDLGVRYAAGLGVTEDEAQAIAWYRKAAEQGLTEAQNFLGDRYAEGRGVTKDDTQAVTWFRKAAEQGLADAQVSLGFMYENGRGVAQDEAQAVTWYRKAAEQGDGEAQVSLGFMYENGRGVAKDDAQAVTWYRNAAEQGYAKAQYRLGFMYANGRGVAKDEAQAITWYRKASEHGNGEAQRELEKITWYREDAQRELEKIKNQVAQKTQTTESLAQEPSQTQIASQPATQTRGVWTTDWGNDIIGLVTTEPCHVAELTNQGYVYAISSSIPLTRLKHNADAWKIVGDRAITVIGCWFKKDTNNTGLIHAKFKRKKDDKIWEDDLNLADGSWTFKRID